jgi:hypothetical protein
MGEVRAYYLEGWLLGLLLGMANFGDLDGYLDGCTVGNLLSLEGLLLGPTVGPVDGHELGLAVGLNDGRMVGNIRG